MRSHIRALVLAAGLVLVATPIFAASCGDILIDEMSAISDKTRVIAAAQRFANSAAIEVRVRAIASRHGAKNIDDFEQTYRALCPEWLASNGKLRSGVFLALYVDNRTSPQWVGVYYGSSLARLDQQYRKIMADRFIEPMKDFRNGDTTALTPAFVGALDDFREIMNRSVSNGGTTTIVHTQPTDLSGFASAFKWLAIGVVVVGFAVAVVFLYSRVSQERGEGQSAQAQARAVRQKCLNRLISITKSDFIAEMEAMVDARKPGLSKAEADELQRLFGTFKRQGEEASAAFNRFDSLDKDPNVNGLSPDAYRSNEQAYEDILASSIEPAEETLKTISKILNSA